VATRPLLSPGRFIAADLLVCALIIALGILPFIFYQRAPDSLHHDVSYVELGKSLLRGSYSFNCVTERFQPPACRLSLHLACSTIGCTHDILIPTMPVFLALGFILSYVIIRRQLGRPTGVASWPSLPYFFVTMLFLFLAPKWEMLENALSRFLTACLLCLLLTRAVMIQSVGIALIGAFLGSTVLSFLRDAPTATQYERMAVTRISGELSGPNEAEKRKLS
jgi:hypothetical protein